MTSQPDSKVNPIDSYDTTIKDIAGLKEYEGIFEAIRLFFDEGESGVDRLVQIENRFDIRTEKGRAKVGWALKGGFLQFRNADHQNLVQRLFSDLVPVPDQNLFLLWQFSLNNRLVRELIADVFVGIYFSGRASISQNDLIGFIKEVISNKTGKADKDWAEETIYRIATKFLSLMTKLGFVSTGRVKKFEYVRPSTEAQVIFLYYAKLFAPDHSDILTNPFLSLSFIAKEDIQERMKKLSMKDYFRMNFNGVALKIELTHSYEEICHVLYN